VIRHDEGRHRTVVVHSAPAPRYYRRDVVVVRPRVVRTVTVLPSGYSVHHYHAHDYFFHEGRYYVRSGPSYAVAFAPFGLQLDILPDGYHRIIVGSVPYYYFMGTFYIQVHPEVYEVVAPEVGAIVPDLPMDDVEEVTIGGVDYYAYDNYLYEPVDTDEGPQFKVIGQLNN
jgi:hypothetical protein